MSVSSEIVLDTRSVKKNGVFPLKLRIIFNRKTKYYPTLYDLSIADYNKLSAPRISHGLEQIREAVQQIEVDSRKFIKKIIPFNLSTFEDLFIINHPHFKPLRRTILSEIENNEFDFEPYKKRFKILEEPHPGDNFISKLFYDYIANLIQEGRIGSAFNYQDTYYSLKRFKGNVQIAEITTSYLNQFERWMYDVRKCNRTTIGIKLRPLRTIYNEAIEKNIVDRKQYPFGRRRYQIPATRKNKRALPTEDIHKLLNSNAENETDEMAKDYWLFCFYGNGMNPKDFACLKYENIEDDFIIFYRSKTDRETKDDPKPIRAVINAEMERIIGRWGNADKAKSNYIFPILSHSDNPLQVHMKVKRLAIIINKGIRSIARAEGIEAKVGNMEGRHSLATLLKRIGANTEFIQEILGHHDKKTTEIYLGEYDDEIKKKYSDELIALKNSRSDGKLDSSKKKRGGIKL